MKHVFLFFIAVSTLLSCGELVNSEKDEVRADIVEVIYFHGKQRCVTCNAIETLTKEVVDEMSNEKVVMKVVDISKKENEAIADKYEVTWSALIIVNRDKNINLTEIGFGYAKNQPDVFKAKLIEGIKSMIE